MKSGIRERTIEAKLVRKVKELGGLCLKWVSPGWVGCPDRILLLPDGRTVFVEVKRPGGKPTAIQLKRHEQLKALSQQVEVVDSDTAIEELLGRLFHES